MKKAPEYMNDVVKNVQEELVEIDLNNGEGGEKLVKISKGLSEEERRKKKADSLVKGIQGCFCLELSRNARFESELGNT